MAIGKNFDATIVRENVNAWINDTQVVHAGTRANFDDAGLRELLRALISDVWKELGWSAIIYLAAIAGVDQEMYEAATVDGATKLQKILRITLPSITGTIAIMLILQVSGLLNSNFDQILILKNQVNISRSQVIDTYVYQVGMTLGKYSYATAVGLFKSIIALILLLIANTSSKKFLGRSLY
jgi:putative aldouronate transport system permease protein